MEVTDRGAVVAGTSTRTGTPLRLLLGFGALAAALWTAGSTVLSALAGLVALSMLQLVWQKRQSVSLEIDLVAHQMQRTSLSGGRADVSVFALDDVGLNVHAGTLVVSAGSFVDDFSVSAELRAQSAAVARLFPEHLPGVDDADVRALGGTTPMAVSARSSSSSTTVPEPK